MEILFSKDKITGKKTVGVLGNFDGLHLAHISVIKKGLEYAKEHNLKSGILLFQNHTRDEKLITPNKIKMLILKQISPDFVYPENFDEQFMKKSPEEFIQMLIDKLNMQAVSVGYDYTFGYKAAGNVETLCDLGEKYGFDTIVSDKICIDNITVSSNN